MYKVFSAIVVTFKEKEALALYQLREVSQVWYTKLKDNRLVESCLIELEEIKGTFIGNYFPYDRGKVKV